MPKLNFIRHRFSPRVGSLKGIAEGGPGDRTADVGALVIVQFSKPTFRKVMSGLAVAGWLATSSKWVWTQNHVSLMFACVLVQPLCCFTFLLCLFPRALKKARHSEPRGGTQEQNILHRDAWIRALLRRGYLEEKAVRYAVLLGDGFYTAERGKWIIRDPRGWVLDEIELIIVT